jgi:hypothetical protein
MEMRPRHIQDYRLQYGNLPLTAMRMVVWFLGKSMAEPVLTKRLAPEDQVQPELRTHHAALNAG